MMPRPGVEVDEQIDNVRDLPGATGVIDIASFLKALDAMGYDGPVAAEPFSKELGQLPNEQAARITLASLDAIWQVAGLE